MARYVTYRSDRQLGWMTHRTTLHSVHCQPLRSRSQTRDDRIDRQHSSRQTILLRRLNLYSIKNKINQLTSTSTVVSPLIVRAVAGRFEGFVDEGRGGTRRISWRQPRKPVNCALETELSGDNACGRLVLKLDARVRIDEMTAPFSVNMITFQQQRAEMRRLRELRQRDD